MKLHKIVCLGTLPVAGVSRSVFCEVTVDEKDGLTIHGVVGPRKGGNCYGSCGQIQDDLDGIKPGEGWTEEMVEEFLSVWREWHLNKMTAGSPNQEAFLKEWRSEHGWKGYEAECAALEEAGLLIDSGFTVNGEPYRYGSAWLDRPLPDEVFGFLRGIPVTSKKPAWV